MADKNIPIKLWNFLLEAEASYPDDEYIDEHRLCRITSLWDGKQFLFENHLVITRHAIKEDVALLVISHCPHLPSYEIPEKTLVAEVSPYHVKILMGDIEDFIWMIEEIL